MSTEELFTKSNMTVKNMAEVFETLDDIDQAQFFVELAAIAKNWPRGAISQWYAIGHRLEMTGNVEAKDIIRGIYSGMALEAGIETV